MTETPKTNDGGTAFPAGNDANVNGTMGMSLRDWFAGQALAALANPNHAIPRDREQMQTAADGVYAMADAMLAARAASSEPSA